MIFDYGPCESCVLTINLLKPEVNLGNAQPILSFGHTKVEGDAAFAGSVIRLSQ